jgi:hypothetical protein
VRLAGNRQVRVSSVLGSRVVLVLYGSAGSMRSPLAHARGDVDDDV